MVSSLVVGDQGSGVYMWWSREYRGLGVVITTALIDISDIVF